MNKSNLPPPPARQIESCVCKLINSCGWSVYRIMGKELAEKWGLDVVFTGDHPSCMNYLIKNPHLDSPQKVTC